MKQPPVSHSNTYELNQILTLPKTPMSWIKRRVTKYNPEACVAKILALSRTSLLSLHVYDHRDSQSDEPPFHPLHLARFASVFRPASISRACITTPYPKRNIERRREIDVPLIINVRAVKQVRASLSLSLSLVRPAITLLFPLSRLLPPFYSSTYPSVSLACRPLFVWFSGRRGDPETYEHFNSIYRPYRGPETDDHVPNLQRRVDVFSLCGAGPLILRERRN